MPRLVLFAVAAGLVAGNFLWGQDAPDAAPSGKVDSLGDPLPPGALARLGTSRLCQSDVDYVALVPDGKRLVSVGHGGTVRLWDAQTGKEIRHWRASGFKQYGAPWALSAHGEYLALVCGDKILRVWDTSNGREVFKHDRDFTDAVAFSPDSKWLAVAIAGRVRIVNPQTGGLRHELEACKYLKGVAFAADGASVVAFGHDKPDRKLFCIYSWDAVTGRQTGDHFFEFPSFFAGRLSADGKHLVVPAPKADALHIWDTSTGKQVAQTADPVAFPVQIAFSADGKLFTTLSRDERVRIWETKTGKRLHEVAAATGTRGNVPLSADGQTVATHSRQDDAIHLWDVATGAERHSFGGHRNGPLSVAFAADGKSVLTTSSDHGFSQPSRRGADWSLRRWDWQTGKELSIHRAKQPSELQYAVFSPNARFLATANTAGVLDLVDTKSGKVERSWKLPTKVTTIRTGKDVKKYEHLSITGLVFSADGVLLAAPSRGAITLYEVATGKRRGELERATEATLRCCFFPDAKSLLVAEWDGKFNALGRIDAETGLEIQRFAAGKNWPNALAISPDGARAARLHTDLLDVYDATTGKVRWNAKLGDWSFALAFSPDSRLLATGGRDNVVRLWDANSGKLLREWSGHDEEVTSLAFSSDSRRLVSGGGNIALVWEIGAFAAKK